MKKTASYWGNDELLPGKAVSPMGYDFVIVYRTPSRRLG